MVPKHLRPLFWDVDLDRFDPLSFPVYTIGRVLELGDDVDVAWLRATFPVTQIADVVRTERRLSRRSANYWALLFGIPIDEVAALRAAS